VLLKPAPCVLVLLVESRSSSPLVCNDENEGDEDRARTHTHTQSRTSAHAWILAHYAHLLVVISVRMPKNLIHLSVTHALRRPSMLHPVRRVETTAFFE